MHITGITVVNYVMKIMTIMQIYNNKVNINVK